MRIIACTEGSFGKLEPYSLEMITAAHAAGTAGDEIVAFFAGQEPEPAVANLGAADRLVAASAGNAQLIAAESYARLLKDTVAAEEPGLVLVPYSANGLDVAGDLAARTGWPLVSYVNEIRRDGDRLNVVHVMRGGPAADTGWRTGDMICSVDGTTIGHVPGEATLSWPIGPAGRTVQLGLCDGRNRALTLRDFY